MDVVGEQAVAEKLYCFLLTVKKKFLQISLPVSVVAKDGLAVVASTDDVIDGSRVFNPNGAGHGGQVTPSPIPLQLYSSIQA